MRVVEFGAFTAGGRFGANERDHNMLHTAVAELWTALSGTQLSGGVD
jgi:hypothetical protein